MARRKTDSARAREMRGVLAELDKSGLTVNQFARQREIAVSRLRYWRKRFRDDAKAKAGDAPSLESPSPYRRRTAAEMRSFIAAWKKSGLTQRDPLPPRQRARRHSLSTRSMRPPT